MQTLRQVPEVIVAIYKAGEWLWCTLYEWPKTLIICGLIFILYPFSGEKP